MELTRQEEQAMNLDRFLSIVKKNTEIEKLTPTILNEFVEKNHRPRPGQAYREACSTGGNQL